MTLSTPDRRAVEKFLQASVLPALEAVARELTRRSRPASVGRDAETGALTLTVPAEGHRDFVYGVQMSEQTSRLHRV
jgi:choline/glycine/proline betaine transport protein